MATALIVAVPLCCPAWRNGAGRPHLAWSPSARHPISRSPSSTALVTARAGSRCRCPPGSRGRRSDRRCGRSSWSRRCSPARRMPRNRSRAWRCTTSANREGDVRFALLSDWVDAPTEQVDGDDEHPARAADRGDRPAERAARGGARRRRAVPHLPPGRGAGTRPRAAGWAGSASAASCTSSTGCCAARRRPDFLTTGPAVVDAADGRPLRRHARCRHAPAARRGRAAGRHDGASAQPARLRSGARAGVAGYGILQPRVTPSLPAEREAARLPAAVLRRRRASTRMRRPSPTSTRTCSAKARYTGKGIYDVDAFEAALAGPRAGEHAAQPRPVRGHLRPRRPGHRHRGGRGVPVATTSSPPPASTAGPAATGSCCPGSSAAPATRSGGRDRTALPAIARWKMVDNLRRTPVRAADARDACRGLDRPDGVRPSLWTAFVLATLVIPRGMPVARWAAAAPAGHLQAQPSPRGRRQTSPGAVQVGLGITLLAAPGMADGRRDRADAGRVLRHAAQPARVDDRGAGQGRRRPPTSSGFYAGWPAGWRWRSSRRARPGREARPAVWLAAPFVAALVGRRRSSRAGSACRRRRRPEQLSAGGRRGAARSSRRRTWRFFETFVGPDDNILPPDNFQDDRRPVVAHRTSPTNIGMYLLPMVTARDFGWIGTCEMVDRLEATLATIDRLERFRGHLYNWYDTRDAAAAASRCTSRRSTAATSPATCSTLANACRRDGRPAARRSPPRRRGSAMRSRSPVRQPRAIRRRSPQPDPDRGATSPRPWSCRGS